MAVDILQFLLEGRRGFANFHLAFRDESWAIRIMTNPTIRLLDAFDPYHSLVNRIACGSKSILISNSVGAGGEFLLVTFPLDWQLDVTTEGFSVPIVDEDFQKILRRPQPPIPKD
jgi:hypothetical protein